jgi:hypothetical protein
MKDSSKKTIGSNHYKGGLTPVASVGSKVVTNGTRKPVKVTGSGKKS